MYLRNLVCNLDKLKFVVTFLPKKFVKSEQLACPQ